MSSFRVLGVLRVVPLVLAISCTGQIGDENGAAPRGGRPGSSGTTGGGTTGGGPSGGGGPGPATGGPLVSTPGVTSRFVRLNHQQWENTVRDVLRLPAPLGLSSTFVAEPLRSTFDTNGTLLSVAPDLWSDYQTAAETVASKVVKDAALLAKITPSAPADPAGKAIAFVRDFGMRAFRRPLTDDELMRYVALFNKGPTLIGSSNAFADGVELVLGALFQSPIFLYRTELSTQVVNGKIPLGDYEIASKLSYALTSTMPDDALFSAAAAKQLETREGVLTQAARILGLPAAEAAVADFHDQLLRMRNFEIVNKDTKAFPLFNAGIGADLKQEALSFVSGVVFDEDRGFAELFSAPYTFANSRLRQIYGLGAGGTAGMFVRTDLDPAQRAGLLTQVGFLASHGEGSMPSIIMRGVHIAKDILCVEVPPPPDMVPPLPAVMPNTTNRQRVATLTANAPCSACHTKVINPLGYAFEKLDAVGAWRTQDNGQTVDASASYEIDGKMVNYDGPVQLSKLIAESQQGHACYARHWIEYLYGRDVDLTNAADIALIANAGVVSKTNPSAKNLILNLVTTESFVARLP